MKLRKLLFLLLLAMPCLAQDLRPSAYMGREGKVTVRGGKILGSSGGVVNISTVDLTPANNATTFIFLDLTGTPVVSSNTTGFPTSSFFPIATVTKDINGTITSFVDSRPDSFMAGGGGAGNSPDGNTGDLQMKGTPPFQASGENDDGTTFKVNRDVNSCGPNPYTDVRCFGVRAVVTQPSSTCTINSGSAVASLPGGASTFINGDGVLCRGAGATVTMSTPGAPTVVAVNNASLLGTAQTVANSGGANTDTYQIIAVDIRRGFTAASTATTITNGAATKGAVSNTVSSYTRSGNVVTVTTASPHGLVTGAMVAITNNNNLSGDYTITVTGGSTFTFLGQFDTNNGAVASGTGGTVVAYFGNHISWSTVTGAYQYVVYRTTGTPKVVCISYPDPVIAQLIGIDPLNDQCDDWGDTITPGPQLPAWTPGTPPGAAKNDDLVTTIVSGAGTTTVTLGTTATNSVVAQPFLFDNTPGIQTASQNVSSTGTMYFPAPANSSANYITASVSQLNGSINVLQSGNILAQDTIILGGGFSRWQGYPATQTVAGSGSFSWGRLPTIQSSTAYPIMWSRSNSSNLDLSFLTLKHSSANQGMVLLIDGQNIPATQLDHVQFLLQGTDAYGEGLTIRANINLGANWNLRYLQFFGGGATTQAPVFQATQAFSPFTIDKIFLFKRGLYLGLATTGIQGSINNLYIQGGIMPTITLGNTAGGGAPIANVSINNVTHDTTIQSLVNYLSNVNGTISVFGTNALQPQVTGPGTVVVIQDSDNPPQGVIGGESVPNRQLVLDGNISTTIGSQFVKELNATEVIGAKFKAVVTSLPQAAPTCAVSAGGSVPLGTYIFTTAPAFSDLSEGPMSPVSNSCTTTSGNQTVTVTWATIPGAIGYDLYHDNVSFQCSPPWVTGGGSTSYVWSSASPCGQSAPQSPGGGPSYIERTGIGAPALTITSADGGGRVGLTMPIGTAARAQNYPDAAGTFLLDTTATSAAGLSPSPYDNFNRANGALGACPTGSPFSGTCWTSNLSTNGSLTITSNQVLGTNGSSNQNSYWTGNPFLNDQYAEVTIATTSANQQGVSLRNTGTTNATTNMYICVENGTAQLQIAKFTNGSFASLQTGVITGAVGDRLRFTIVGSAETCTLTSAAGVVTTITAADASFSSGSPGIHDARNTGGLVNWTGGSLPKNAAFVVAEQEFNGHQHINNGALTVGNIPSTSTGTALTNGFIYAQGLVLGNSGSQITEIPLQRGIVTSAYTNATTTASNITGLSFSVAASTNYAMTCQLYYQGSAATAGLDITITGPASPTNITYSYDERPTAASVQNSIATAFASKLTGNATVTATTNLQATVTMGLVNGANAGTVQVQGSATGTGTVTVQPGSFCQLQ